MVEMLPRALATEDEDISKILERELKKEKIKLIVNERIEKVDVRGGGVVARLKGGDEIKAEKALVSIGRAFNTDEIGLEAVEVSLAKNKSIAADSKMETNVPGIYAAGDVAGGKLLAHKGSAEGIVAVSNALGVEKEMNYLAVPAGIFTHPEVGSVGLTEAQAREGDRPVKVGRFLYRAIGKPHATGELVGEVKIVADEADRGDPGRPHHRRVSGRSHPRGDPGHALGAHGGGAGRNHPRPPHRLRGPHGGHPRRPGNESPPAQGGGHPRRLNRSG